MPDDPGQIISTCHMSNILCVTIQYDTVSPTQLSCNNWIFRELQLYICIFSLMIISLIRIPS